MNLRDYKNWFAKHKKELPKKVWFPKFYGKQIVNDFIQCHINILEMNSGDPEYISYWNRLLEMKEICEKEMTKTIIKRNTKRKR